MTCCAAPERNDSMSLQSDYAHANGERDDEPYFENENCGNCYEYEREREMLIYWLLKSYDALKREGWEAGKSPDAIASNLLDVLANLDYDPNESDEAKELVAREPVFSVQ